MFFIHLINNNILYKLLFYCYTIFARSVLC